MRQRQVLVYSRAGCHLCEKAIETDCIDSLEMTNENQSITKAEFQNYTVNI